jgi:hypothetical protein
MYGQLHEIIKRLKDGVTRQNASTYTYFHLHENPSAKI